MEERVKAMEAGKPVANPEQWDIWKQDVQVGKNALAQVAEKVAELKTARPATDRPTTYRPRSFIGLVDAELGLFRSYDILERNLLRNRLTNRILAGQKRPVIRKDPEIAKQQLNADIAWRQGIELRKIYSAEDIEKQVPNVLKAVASMSPDEAAEQIPVLLKRMVYEARATATPAQHVVPAAGAGHTGILDDLPAGTSSATMSQPSPARLQHE